MDDISIGQVILANFPFSNLTNKKLRPCLVIGIAEFNDIVLCQITSKRYSSKRAVSLKKTDFAKGSIVIDSFIRPDKIATLDRAMISNTLGSITKIKLDEVKLKLKTFLEIN
jgi:mRNA interferase MazF